MPVTRNDWPVGADSNLDFWLGAVLMAVPLAGLLIVLADCGSGYLHRVQPATAFSVDLAFLGTFASPAPLFWTMLGRANWGLVVFSAIFLMIGVAMIAVITTAAREAKRRPVPGQLM